MRYSFIAAALLVSHVLAIPVAQASDSVSTLSSDASTTQPADGLPTDAYDAIPDSPNWNAPANDDPDPITTTYTPTAAQTAAATAVTAAIADGVITVIDAAPTSDASSRRAVSKRGTCLPYSPGNGPAVYTPDDSVASWYADPTISGTALTASAPAGYVLADGYLNLNASTSSSTYLTYISDDLTSYDPSVCSAKCDTIAGCVSFNIYFERDPSEDADDVNCPTPPSITRIKCAFFSSMMTTGEATNMGQYQSQFHVVIGGSNVYNKPPMTIPNYSGPVNFGNAAIESPTADNTYMRVQTFSQTQPYDPSICAAACDATNAYVLRHGQTRFCKFFDAYILYKNGVNGVFTCTYYTQPYGVAYAKNKGQYNSHGDHYTVGYSVGYAAN